MTQTPESNLEQHHHDVGEWLTKSQLARTNNGKKTDIDALVKLGYLFPIRLGPRMVRFWSTDAKKAIDAFRNHTAPPAQTKFAHKPFDWKV